MAKPSIAGRRKAAASDANRGAGRPRNTTPVVSIVDDDESCREAIAGLMNWLGFGVQTFASAIEFLASPGLAGSSCVITDVQMPQMTGIELLRRITELGYAIPTILVTAYPDDAMRQRALADGAVCYLEKPFDNDALIECVRRALQRLTGH